MRPDNAWIQRNYRMGEPGPEGGPPPMVCRLCNAEVDWLTRHAAERHGDAVEVLPTVRPEPAGGWKW